MNSSQLWNSSLSPVSPCIHPVQCRQFPLSRISCFLCKRRRLRLSVSCSASSSLASDSVPLPPRESIFGHKRELNDVQSLVERLPKQLRIMGSVIITAAALAAGYTLGLRFGRTRNLALGGAAVAGLVAGATVHSFNSSAPEVAAIQLHNFVAEVDDPKDIRKEDVDAISNKYGVSKDDGAFVAELRDIYCRFVTSVLPPGGKDLQGNEADIILNFKNALGIDDPDAAAMHMEIGRRIFRERLEAGGRDGNVEQRRAFQKLIYVSNLVFGKSSAYLLPWKRVFKVTDAQVDIAIRDNAERLYALTLKSVGRDVDEEQLSSLKQAQLQYKLPDELAAELFRERMGMLIDNNVLTALDILKSNTRSGDVVKKVVVELEKILHLNEKLTSLSKNAEAASFACGVGPVSLISDDFGNSRKIDDVKLLYSVYVTDALSGGCLEEDKRKGVIHLPEIFGIKKEEAEAITLEITSKVYRRCLSQSFSTGELHAAPSKAAYLQTLCEKLHFDAQAATKVNEEIYRQKLQKCVAKGLLSEDDGSALNRIRHLLCIPHRTVDAIHSEICGALFEKVVYDAIASGVEGFDEFLRKAVVESIRGLRLSEELAMSIASKSILKMFLVYVKRATVAKKRSKRAEELKKMLSFNTFVATALISDIKSEFPDSSEEKTDSESVLEFGESDGEWQSLETLKKAKAAEKLAAKITKPCQTKINLKGEIPIDDRMELYKKYLIHCISGKVVALPFGPQLPIKTDNSEYVYLNQLGNLLGLTAMEIVEVHRGLAERAFQKKAEKLLSDGKITKAKIDHLTDIQQNIGLPPDFAQGVIKSVTSSKMATVLRTALDRGSLSIKQIRELKEASVDLSSLVSEQLREELFRKTVDEMLSSGTGEFDADEVYQNITSDLSISAEKAKAVVEELARRRLPNALVEGVAMLRQKNRHGVVMMLNDLLACDKAVPSPPLLWERSAELSELYSQYVGSDPAPEKLARLQYLLGLSDSEAAGIRETAKAVKENVLLLETEQDNFVF